MPHLFSSRVSQDYKEKLWIKLSCLNLSDYHGLIFSEFAEIKINLKLINLASSNIKLLCCSLLQKKLGF